MTTTAAKKRKIRESFVRGAHYEPDLRNPRTFNEKIQWLKLYYRDPLMTQCTDKIAVRDFVASRVGTDVLVPLLGTWDRAEDIDFDALPERYVLKTNHSSGTNIIVRDARAVDVDASRAQLADWMRPAASHYAWLYEWAYRDITPRVLAEEYIDAHEGDLKDYKFMCFDGRVDSLFVCSERDTGLKVDFFDLDWRHLPFTRHYPNSARALERPASFDAMVRIAEALSAPFPFVRVDLYEIDGRVQFGELTFYPGGGLEAFDPVEWDRRYGDMIRLPRRRFGWGMAHPGRVRHAVSRVPGHRT